MRLKHLWHHKRSRHVRSECGLRPPKLHSTDLTFCIGDVECINCINIRIEYAKDQLAQCEERLDLMPHYG